MTNYAKFFLSLALALFVTPPAQAHKLREQGVDFSVAKSSLTVTPTRDWNRLNGRRGKRTERWTLDGPQLNDVTFFGGVEGGTSLFKGRGQQKDALPKFERSMLLIDIPTLLDSTYRVTRGMRSFDILDIEPQPFLGAEGVGFSYQMIASNGATLRGEARAVILDGELFMITYEAPRLFYFETYLSDFQKLLDSARIG
ncbi:hypothetical protein MWU38_10285 [Qipengyuania sp. S6317L1]|uniref:hypothetical protein n=1 Tax=Qipengyuania sp. S6317L1 TaxID=2926410 RepID=UPI001FF6EF1C|nr:hypothetical protein [Qipengyuania sp. S6317L1]MCK0099772.1 hypothetical protein [Qipengyuania sp. S6317L1]